jgi:hypothetical protein
MVPFTSFSQSNQPSDFKIIETLELEMRRLVEVIAEELLFQKFPRKMKETPKTIHFTESLRIIEKSQI